MMVAGVKAGEWATCVFLENHHVDLKRDWNRIYTWTYGLPWVVIRGSMNRTKVTRHAGFTGTVCSSHCHNRQATKLNNAC